jgi:hypothetical protein
MKGKDAHFIHNFASIKGKDAYFIHNFASTKGRMHILSMNDADLTGYHGKKFKIKILSRSFFAQQSFDAIGFTGIITWAS